ncbi:hypothetical protein N7U49_38410 [Streptomyces sp. AD2-2]|nr:hypothetical protein N7U49_38410 [Streptomyces sp. AD2-2]
MTERLKGIFSTRVAALPDATRKLLLLAVLDGSGELHVLQRALGAPDGLAGLSPAERAGLVQVRGGTGRLEFRHPLTRSAVMELSTSEERRWAHRALAAEFPEGSEHRARHLADAAVGPDDQVAALLHEVAYSTLRRGDAVGAISTLLRASELSGSGTAKARRLAEAACLGANITGDLRNVRALLDNAGHADPTGLGSLAAATAAASRLLNGEGDVDTAHRLLLGAINTHVWPEDGETVEDIFREALNTLLLVCFYGGRPELWRSFEEVVVRRRPRTSRRLLPLILGTFADPAYGALPFLDRLDHLISDLHQQTDPVRIFGLALAASYTDRLPGCRSALRRVVDDGRDGGAVALAIQAQFLLANDAYASGQWDELLEVTAEGLGWCETHDYRLAASTGHFQRGLVAAARVMPRRRGRSRTGSCRGATRAGWGRCGSTPRRSGPCRRSAARTSTPPTVCCARSAPRVRCRTSRPKPCGCCWTSPRRRPAPTATRRRRHTWRRSVSPTSRRSRPGWPW